MAEKTEADKIIELSSKEALFWKEHGDIELNKQIEAFHILCVDLYHYAKGLEFALKCQGKLGKEVEIKRNHLGMAFYIAARTLKEDEVKISPTFKSASRSIVEEILAAIEKAENISIVT